jgi:hypothetical protein
MRSADRAPILYLKQRCSAPQQQPFKFILPRAGVRSTHSRNEWAALNNRFRPRFWVFRLRGFSLMFGMSPTLKIALRLCLELNPPSRLRYEPSIFRSVSLAARFRVLGPTAQAHPTSAARGNQAPRPRRGIAYRDWPKLQRQRRDDFEAIGMSCDESAHIKEVLPNLRSPMAERLMMPSVKTL